MFGKRSKANELEIPDVVKSDSDAIEVLRVWASQGNPQTFTLRAAHADPGAWGLLLVDIARHVGRAYANRGEDEGSVLARIKEMWQAEWDNPTDLGTELT